jgi:hypothetical protein
LVTDDWDEQNRSDLSAMRLSIQIEAVQTGAPPPPLLSGVVAAVIVGGVGIFRR